ncbi:hypothetical protein SLEP1_g4266 [Rubroshorea leprosula]|uniref:Uncharacterized protein n=1 Tax=Rubroshorea leprosula TaxID=152421 RepID=A0AAV5HX08_9ROSI|nr:hypothetical protein SLEP1_g4266 [Rubroshorea leprosula]
MWSLTGFHEKYFVSLDLLNIYVADGWIQKLNLPVVETPKGTLQ